MSAHFRDKPYGRQPCAPYREGYLVGQNHAARLVHSAVGKMRWQETGVG